MKLTIDGTISKLKSLTSRLMDFEEETDDSVFDHDHDLDYASDFKSEMHPFIEVYLERRELLGWTIEDIAKKTGMPSTVIHEFETGKRMPTWEILEKYANSLGLVIALVEETPILDLLEKQSTTELITALEIGQIAYGDCGKYIKKDPATKAVLECTKEGEPLGPLSLTEEVMNAKWVILLGESNKQTPQTDNMVSQSELEKEIFLNVIYSDLNVPQLYSYLTSVKDKISNEELFHLINAMCEKLQSIQEAASLEEAMIEGSSQDELKQQIIESKEQILQHFFKGVDLQKKEQN